MGQAFGEEGIFVNRGAVVGLQVYFRLHAIIERAPQQFVGHGLSFFSDNFLGDAQVHSQDIDVSHDDVFLVGVSIDVAILQHGSDIHAVIAVEVVDTPRVVVEDDTTGKITTVGRHIIKELVFIYCGIADIAVADEGDFVAVDFAPTGNLVDVLSEFGAVHRFGFDAVGVADQLLHVGRAGQRPVAAPVLPDGVVHRFGNVDRE